MEKTTDLLISDNTITVYYPFLPVYPVEMVTSLNTIAKQCLTQ